MSAASQMVAASGQPKAKSWSTSRRRHGVTITLIASGNVSASLSVPEIVEEVNERDIDRFGHELRLAAREEAAERAARTAGVGDDLAEPGAVDAALTDERRGTLHHARASWRSPAIGGRVLRFVLRSHGDRVGHFDDDRHRFC